MIKLKRKVLVVGQFPPPVQGTTVMAKNFVETLSKIYERIIIVEKKFSKNQQEVGKISVLKILKIPGFCLRTVISIINNKPDFCVYFISVLPRALYIDCVQILILKAFNIPAVLYFHGKGYKENSDKSILYNYIVKYTFSKSFAGIVLGSLLKDDVKDFISEEKLFILPNAIEMYITKEVEIRKESNANLKILYLSNLIASKGAYEFIEMAKSVRNKHQKIEFILAGSIRKDEFFHKLKNYINNNRLKDNVKIVGPVYGDSKKNIFLNADIFVFPTYYKLETFGLVNLEAMQFGLPIITTNEGAIPEVVRNGINGYIVDPKNKKELSNAVLKLVENDELRMKMSKMSRALFLKYYTLDAYRENLQKIAIKIELSLRSN
jgi:glycosyltransferase involved in cell wall biosynthesis